MKQTTLTRTGPPNRPGPNWRTALGACVGGFMAGVILVLVCLWPSDRPVAPQTLDIPVEISATVETVNAQTEPDAATSAKPAEVEAWPEIAPWERADAIDIRTGEPQAKQVGGDITKPYGFAEVTP